MSDNILAAVVGALEGFNKAAQPYFQAKYEDQLATKRRQQQIQDELAVYPQKLEMQNDAEVAQKQALLPYEIEKARALQQPEIPITKSEAIRRANSGQTMPFNSKVIDDSIDERADQRATERKMAKRGDLVKTFNADALIKKSNSAIDAANNIIELLNANNPIADGSLPTFMARASGEVGNLSEADKAPFGGSQAVMAKLQQAYERAKSGKLDDQNRQFLRSLAETMQKSNRRNLAETARRYGKQYGSVGVYGSDREIFDTLAPGMEFEEQPGEQGREAKKAQGGWDDSKEQRYQELLKKKQSGTLR